MEDKFLPVDAGSSGNPNSPRSPASSIDEIGSRLQKIESKLEAIEQRLQHRPAETAFPAALPERQVIHDVKPVDIHTAQTGHTSDIREESTVPILRRLELRKGLGSGPVPEDKSVPRARPRSSSRPTGDDLECEDVNSETDISSASTSGKLITPRPDSEEAGLPVPPSALTNRAPELNRDVLRQKINRALAGAMIELTGLLGEV